MIVIGSFSLSASHRNNEPCHVMNSCSMFCNSADWTCFILGGGSSNAGRPRSSMYTATRASPLFFRNILLTKLRCFDEMPLPKLVFWVFLLFWRQVVSKDIFDHPSVRTVVVSVLCRSAVCCITIGAMLADSSAPLDKEMFFGDAPDIAWDHIPQFLVHQQLRLVVEGWPFIRILCPILNFVKHDV